MHRKWGQPLNLLPESKNRSISLFLHPVIFVGSITLLGLLFGLQDWIHVHTWNKHTIITFRLLMAAWGVQYFLLGTMCWLLWWRLGKYVQTASLRTMLLFVLPLSLVVSVLEEMIWVAVFPQLPLGMTRMTFWQRVVFELDAELADSLVFFWCVFFLLRGIGYYQLYREKETKTLQLETQIANAQLRALRMQLNPHFLFNTMNSISSLMQTDIAAADKMLEQLSSLLRITLERGEVQLIPLSDEMEFIEMYLAMQDRRFTGRVHQQIYVEPNLHDALIPAMLLQPVIENAYTHGLSKLARDGRIAVDIRRQNDDLAISVINTGLGLHPASANGSEHCGVGLANVKARLHLHYGLNQAFAIEEPEQGNVRVTLRFPLQFAETSTGKLTGYGVQ